MYLECGFYEVETESTEMFGHEYYVCRHRFNPSKVELVFIKGKELEGKKELCQFIKKEIISKG